MGVRKRKKFRNTSQFRLNSKRTQKKRKRIINPPIRTCNAVKKAWIKTKPPRTNINNMGLVFHLDDIKIKKTPQEASTSAEQNPKKRVRKKKAKTTEVVEQIEEEVATRVAAKKESVARLTNAQVEYAQSMLTKYGDNYKDMARDPRNYFQDTWKQIRAKIKLFTNNPHYYVPFLKKRNLLKEERLKNKKSPLDEDSGLF